MPQGHLALPDGSGFVFQRFFEALDRRVQQATSSGSIHIGRSGVAILPEDLFRTLLYLERLRTERSGRHFILMLVECGNLLKRTSGSVLAKIDSAITEPTRATDIKGWYVQNSIIGVIFTEMKPANDKSVLHAISTKITASLQAKLTVGELDAIHITFHRFPENWDSDSPDSAGNLILHKELRRGDVSQKAATTVKRVIDVLGSITALLVFLPLMVVIALAVKLTSKGPVLFRQVRLGQYGSKFTFLKFRSMYVNSDHRLHEEYIDRFIKGLRDAELTDGNAQTLYKLTGDPRITAIGRFLRKTSLDELPQFLNVIRGEMSLVGPRPPVPYEVERYDLWHRQRLLTVKPGITGLWQVEGRSRVKFDDMVRLDIRYARSWSIWLDIKILMQTPRAVILGSGAH
jgi:lipopolysaccharide/colanic/teichoic acid biosynthesis glycosyltransferase